MGGGVPFAFHFRPLAQGISMLTLTLSIVIITLNEEANLERTIPGVVGLANEIIVLDSGSTDRIREVSESFQAKFLTRPWERSRKRRGRCDP